MLYIAKIIFSVVRLTKKKNSNTINHSRSGEHLFRYSSRISRSTYVRARKFAKKLGVGRKQEERRREKKPEEVHEKSGARRLSSTVMHTANSAQLKLRFI